MKRRFTLLAIATFVSTSLMAAWTGNSSIWTNGSGDKDDPYLIESEANLAYLAAQVNSGADYSGVYFKQMVDLDLGGVQKADGTWDDELSKTWVPIGTCTTTGNISSADAGKKPFKGHFNGNGYVISNIYINNSGSIGSGLFGYVESGALDSITIINGFIFGYQYSAAICGALYKGTISYCANNATVYGKMERNGGICGGAESSTITDCINYGFLSGFNFIGGILGHCNKSTVTVENCINVGQVFGMRITTGNLIGFNLDKSATVRNCFFDNQINASIGMATTSFNTEGTRAEDGDLTGQIEGKPTSEMIGTTLESYFNSESEIENGTEKWFFESNMYPRLKNTKDNSAIIVAATPVKLTSGDKADNVANDFTVSNANNSVIWESGNEENLTISGNTASIVRSTSVVLIAKHSVDTIYKKEVYLRTNMGGQSIGSLQEPLPIGSKADLIELRDAVNNYSSYKGCANYDGFKNIYFKITVNTIDLSSWTESIGIHNSFKGNIDGQDCNISNISISLFGSLSQGEIKNLIIKSGSIEDKELVGGICGASFNETFTNCTSNCTMNCNGKVDIGGITGCDRGFSSFINCTNTGTITAGQHAGGILGRSQMGTTFRECKNEGSITSNNTNVGGICGTIASTKCGATIENCENHKPITATSKSSIGGIIGTITKNASQDIIISNCINTSEIKGSSSIGGIVGSSAYINTEDPISITISSCLNLGAITGNSTNSCGIIGSGSTVSISNCFNAGKSSGNGIASNGTISNCINIGKAETKAIASTTEESITNCFYDNQMSSASDTYATSKGTSNMVGESLNLGADWIYTSGLYPMIKALENSKYMIVAATPVILKEGETVNGVSTKFTYGTENHVEWSCNEPDYVSFINGTAYPANPGPNAVDVVITVSKDSTTFKKIAMKINKSTGTTTSISWVSDLGSIEYGEKIPESKFSATVNVSTPENGTIQYSVSKDSILHAGNYHITATFIPNEGSDYMPSSKSATLKVTKKDVHTLEWIPENYTYTYGASDNMSKIESAIAKVNGIAVDGTFVYDIPTLTVGEQNVSITDFISTNYKLADTIVRTRTINVNPIAATISWTTPASISYGTPLTSQQLSAFSPIEGTLVYKIGDEVVTATSGKILNGGSHTITATLTPTSPNYAEATKSVTITIDPILPTIVWENPADITFGTLLSDKQLNAKVDGVSGDFTYTPNFGELLKAENNKILRVDFKPKGTDSVNYKATYKEVKINVIKADAIIDWEYPANITYGTALSETQLNAAVHGVIGTFTYNHNIGDKLSAGKHELTVDFTPTGDDINNCNAASKTVILTIDKAIPEITWDIAENIIAGTALTEDEHLNAKANIGGSFVYKDGENTINADDVLSAGSHQLTAIFTPADTANYKSKSKTITISVKMNATITWSNPAPIVYGTALSATQLNATSNVEGTIIYKENDTEISIGTILSVGSHTITALLPETDSYNAATAQATIVVTSPEDETAIAETEVTFSVYPNPTADVFFVETDSNVENIFIYNAQGALVKVEPNTGKTRIDISDVETGTYFVKVGEKTIKLLKF